MTDEIMRDEIIAQEEEDEEKEVDEEEEREEQQTQQNQPTKNITTNLSKSWKIKEINATLYTGGKIVTSHGKNSLVLPPATDTTLLEAEKEEAEEGSIFIAALCNGHISLIDHKKGTKVYELHHGSFLQNDSTILSAEEEEEEDNLDEDSVTTFCLSHDDVYLTTISPNHLLRMYNLQTLTCAILGKESSLIQCMEYHPSGAYLAIGGMDGTVNIWDVREGFVTHSYAAPTSSNTSGALGSVSCMEWLPSNTHILVSVGRENGGLNIYDLNDGSTSSKKKKQRVIALDGHVNTITTMQWSAVPNAKDENRNEFLGVSGSRDQVIFVWKISVKPVRNKSACEVVTKQMFTCPLYEQVESMVLLPCSSKGDSTWSWDCVTGGSSGVVKQWEVILKGKEDVVSMELKVTQAEQDQYGSENGGYGSILPLNKGEVLIVDAEYNIHTLSSKSLQKSNPAVIIGNWDEIFDVKLFSRQNHQYLAIATNSTNIFIQDLQSKQIYILKGHTAIVLAIDLSPCGSYLISCSKDRTMRLWSLLTNKMECVGVAKGHTEAIGATALSRKMSRYGGSGGGGAFVISASKDRTMKKWNLPMGEDEDFHVLMSVKAHDKDINIVSIAPNDTLIATGSQDKTVKIWESSNLSLKGTLVGHKRGVWDCQFSPLDRVIASASGDKSIKLWSLKDFSCLRTFQGHLESVLRIRFLTAGLQLLSSGSDGLIKLWTIRTNECEATLDHHTDKIWAMDYSNLITNTTNDPTTPDHHENNNTNSSLLVTGGGDSQIIFWTDVTQQKQQEQFIKREEYILLEQRLSNYLHLKQYKKAMNLGLHMDKPKLVLKVLTTLISKESTGDEKESTILYILQTHIKTLGEDRIIQLLKYIRDWNTHARNATVAMIVLRAIFMSISLDTLSTNQKMNEILSGITPYLERHMERVDKLYMDSFVLDYFLVTMTAGMVMDEEEEEYEAWVKHRKLVEAPVPHSSKDLEMEHGSDDEVVTIGDSSSSSDEDDSIDGSTSIMVEDHEN